MPVGDPRARAYSPVRSPKWIAEDGRSLWLVFSDIRMTDLLDSPLAHCTMPGTRPYYCFNYQKVEILTD
jgi:hypothetical protein